MYSKSVSVRIIFSLKANSLRIFDRFLPQKSLEFAENESDFVIAFSNS